MVLSNLHNTQTTSMRTVGELLVNNRWEFIYFLCSLDNLILIFYRRWDWISELHTNFFLGPLNALKRRLMAATEARDATRWYGDVRTYFGAFLNIHYLIYYPLSLFLLYT